MLKIISPIGNIYDKEFKDLKDGHFEKLYLSRIELEKRILRKKTDHGTDVGISLEQGVKLHSGDIIDNGKTKIIIQQLPEKVISVILKTKSMIDVMVLLGHIIGNRHKPIHIGEDEILFPITDDSEKEIFTKLFQSIIHYIEITIKEQIFFPQTGNDIHGH